MKILHNARIYTLDPNLPVATTMVIEQEKIVFVGEGIPASLSDAKRENMHGKVILPGLTDAHIHLQSYAQGLKKVDCETDSLTECLRRVEERVRETPSGAWVLGHGWNQNSWTPARFPSKRELDKIAPNNPVYLTAKSLHAAWVNSAALKAAKITANTPDPADGKIMRDAHGQPTGILLEWAYFIVRDILPQPDIGTIAQAIEDALPALWKMGLTGVHDFDWPPCFTALQRLHSQKKLRLRVTKNLLDEQLPHAIALGLRSGFGNDFDNLLAGMAENKRPPGSAEIDEFRAVFRLYRCAFPGLKINRRTAHSVKGPYRTIHASGNHFLCPLEPLF
ncbi:MAG: amidohydrolase family protein [Anaerolineales bacterium]|nr:amidohydrolase family protein [Anaerolineales bacterium]